MAFADRVRAAEDRETLIALVSERFEAVDRAQALVANRVEAQTADLASAEREFEALLDTVRADLAAAGEDTSSLDVTDLVDAVNEGRVSDETRERVREVFPSLKRSAATSQETSARIEGILEDVTAESALYRDVANRVEEGASLDELRDAIVHFVEEESRYGDEGETAVDVVVERYDPERSSE